MELKKSISTPMLGQLVASALLICFVGYQASASENIGNSIYCSGWERGLTAMPGIRARLLLVAIRTSKPVVFTAGSLFDLSLSSYTTLVKTSYSAVTVLRRFQHS
ncbi:unnamed protein product, partial [Brenthis ino]